VAGIVGSVGLAVVALIIFLKRDALTAADVIIPIPHKDDMRVVTPSLKQTGD